MSLSAIDAEAFSCRNLWSRIQFQEAECVVLRVPVILTFLTRRRTRRRQKRGILVPLAYRICNAATGSWESCQCPAPQSHVRAISRVHALNLLLSTANMLVWTHVLLKHLSHHFKEHSRDRFRI